MEYYIKKNDVVSLLMKEAKSHDLSFSAEAYERAANLTACMPNEDVQPVRHGRWVDDKTCSNCGFDILYNYGISGTGFCPNCGADMREEGKK